MNLQKCSYFIYFRAITFVIISSYLAIGEITKFKNVKEILQIIISIVGLFATFGGAYLGAKFLEITLELWRVLSVTKKLKKMLKE